MSDATALFAAIRAAPDDDAPRLVCADWLDEHGQAERAEFIRVQIERTRNDSPALRKREQELLANHHDAFVGPLAAPGIRLRFRRGFVVAFGHTGHFRRVTAGLLLRFCPDGTWLFGTPTRALVEWAYVDSQPLRSEDLGVARGTFRMNAFDDPVSIDLFCSDYERMGIECRGVLDNGSIQLSLRSVADGGVLKPEPYVHFHNPGFDSFAET